MILKNIYISLLSLKMFWYCIVHDYDSYKIQFTLTFANYKKKYMHYEPINHCNVNYYTSYWNVMTYSRLGTNILSNFVEGL